MVRQVTAAVIQKEGKYLIAKRKEKGSLAGKWEFPGGKLDAGETLEEGLKRELFEEFEIQVSVGEFITSHRFNNGEKQYELMAFHVEYVSGEYVLNEHTEMKWVPLAEISSFDFADSDKAVIARLQELEG